MVTGACGFVGTHMVEFLKEKGFDVRATDLKTADHTYLDKLGVSIIPSDLTKKESLKKVVEGVDYIFHTASVYDFSAPWKLLYKVNVEGTKNLCEVALSSDIECMVHWSSGAVYGFPKELPTKETSPVAPTNNYEKSKAEQEKVVLRYEKENGLPATVIRPAVIYGPRSKYGAAIVLFMVAKGQLPAIPGSGKNTGTYVHVADVVNSAFFLTTKKEAIGEVYNVADDTHYTVDELLPYIAEQLGVKIYRFHIPLWLIKLAAKWAVWRVKGTNKRPKIEPDTVNYLTCSYWMDNSKIKALGYKFLYPDVKKGMKEVIEWYKKEGWV